MRTFGFSPQIYFSRFHGYPQISPTTLGYPFPAPAIAYCHPTLSCDNAGTSYRQNMQIPVDIRRYATRYEYPTDGFVASLSTPTYHCSCSGLQQQCLLTSPPLSSASYNSKKHGIESLSPPAQDKRLSSIFTLRTKAKEYEQNYVRIKTEFDEKEESSQQLQQC